MNEKYIFFIVSMSHTLSDLDCCVSRRKVAPLDSISSFQMSSFRNRKVSYKRKPFMYLYQQLHYQQLNVPVSVVVLNVPV